EPRLDDLVAERVTLRARREVRQPAEGGGRVGGVVTGVGLGARAHRHGASQLPRSARGRTVTVRHAPVFGTGTRGGDATSRTCLLSEALFCPCPPPPLANPSRRVTLRDRTAGGPRGGRPTARAVRGCRQGLRARWPRPVRGRAGLPPRAPARGLRSAPSSGACRA